MIFLLELVFFVCFFVVVGVGVSNLISSFFSLLFHVFL
jgi:hypothetical protein